jgi:hypothetical protein
MYDTTPRVSDQPRWDSAALSRVVDDLAGVNGTVVLEGIAGPDPADGLPSGDAADRELLAQLRELERVKAAAAAAQARVTVAFASAQRARAQRMQERARGTVRFDDWRAARGAPAPGVGEQVALARRLSPWQGRRALSLASRLASDLPCTLLALQTGAISEWRAVLIARATSHLSSTDQQAVDAEFAADLDALGQLGDRELERRVSAAAYRHDPQGAVDRARTAEAERRVTFGPAPDTMCRLSAMLPVAQGVAVFAALNGAAATSTVAGDPRSRGQVMADTLVERVTGQAHADQVPVEVQVVLSAAALQGTGVGADDPAQVPGYGSVPAGWARDLIRGRAGDANPVPGARVWLRRLFASPDASTLVAMESTRRLFDAGLRQFLIARDGSCRTPWCDARVRHVDHVQEHTSGGPTSAANGQGLCERCNYTKSLPGWKVEVVDDGRAGPHTVCWSTPTGLAYRSTAPPLLPGATQMTMATGDPEPRSGGRWCWDAVVEPAPVARPAPGLSVIEATLARLLAA